MRAVRFLASGAVAVCLAASLTDGASGAGVQRRYRLVRAGDDKGRQHPPGPFLTGPSTCTPDVHADLLQALPANLRTVPEIFGAGFDPADFDEISVAGDGKILALATSLTEAGIPGVAKQIVLLPEGGPSVASIRIPLAAVSDDQPSVQLDDFGYRCVFRSAAGPGGAAPSNIQLYSLTDDPLPAVTATLAVTTGTSESSFDPAFTARTRVREIGGGIKVRERDARVAFVSTDDLAGVNPSNLEQLFLWEEQGAIFRQLTHHTDPAAHVSRPSISKSGAIIDFESTADLLPGAVDPMDHSRVGNPGHVRQIYRWRRGQGLRQLTWSDGDCFSPRMEVNGRFVLFACRGDPITGGNPERNLEIFMWRSWAKPALRLRQLTQTADGDSVFPRPTLNPQIFTFYSTAHPPGVPDFRPPNLATNTVPSTFGEGYRECTPQALLYDHGKVSHIHGFSDSENATRALNLSGQLFPVLTGPPVPGIRPLKVYFATNDYHLNAKPAAGEDPDLTTSLFAFYVAMATRYAR